MNLKFITVDLSHTIATNELDALKPLHPIFKAISGQTRIRNSKPANWDDDNQHSDFLGWDL